MRALIRADGSQIELGPTNDTQVIANLLNAETLTTVSLKHMGSPLHVMLLDDAGHDNDLPVNVEATRLYLLNCRPGAKHQIRGDVVVVPDNDFARN